MSGKRAPKRRMKCGLTALESRFCAEYVIDFLGGPALRRAGSQAQFADQQAHEMLQKLHIIAEIERLIAAKNERSAVDAAWVKAELVILYQGAKAAAGGNPTERATALRILEKIGQHVDVNAFRAQIGLGTPNGEEFNYDALSDERLALLIDLLSEAAGAVTGGGEGRDGETAH